MIDLFDDYQIDNEHNLVNILKSYPPNSCLADLAKFLLVCEQEDEEDDQFPDF